MINPALDVGDWIIQPRVIEVTSANEQILDGDSRRWSVQFTSDLSVGQCEFWPASMDSALVFLRNPSNDVPLRFTYAEFGPMVGFPWFCSPALPPQLIQVISIAYRPTMRRDPFADFQRMQAREIKCNCADASQCSCKVKSAQHIL